MESIITPILEFKKTSKIILVIFRVFIIITDSNRMKSGQSLSFRAFSSFLNIILYIVYQCLHRFIALSTTRAILPMAPIITHLFMIHPPQTPLSAESPLRIARTSATLAPCRHAGRLRTPRPFLP